MDDLQRRKTVGQKLRAARTGLGLSLADVCGLLGKEPTYRARLFRIERARSSKGGKQSTDGASLDFLLLEDLARLYGRNLDHFMSRPKVSRRRNHGDVMATAKSGKIRKFHHSSRYFAFLNGELVTLGRAVKSAIKKGWLQPIHKKKFTLYMPK